MKSTHKVVRYDYSNFSDNPCIAGYAELKKWEFWGIHSKNRRKHIDTKRFIKMCKEMGADEYIFEGMNKNRNTPYLIPKKEHREDYSVNMFRDLLIKFRTDWNDEYKPIFDKIETPNEVYENSRINMMCYTSCSDDYDDIEVEARLASVRRINQYQKIMMSLYFQFIQKLSTEVDRITFKFMKKQGFVENEFNLKSFKEFSKNIQIRQNKINISELKKYESYDLMRKINNFLKHNSIKAYNDIKKHYPNNVATIENQKYEVIYENGMYAGDFIILEDGYIDKLIEDLYIFFEDYCEKILGEDLEESKWNYDDFFIDAYFNLRAVDDYMG